jgi:predicted MFS family arabinose efflux permease
MTTTSPPELAPRTLLLMAIACGAMVANLYYAQTLVATIGPAIGLSARAAGLVVTLTQLGYGLGLALIVPLSDMVENKRLILVATAGAVLGSIGVALARDPALFLVASLLMGTCSVGAQVLVPLASHLSRPETQGRTIGLVMSGLLTGIMLARPAASFLAHLAGWRSVFWLSALLVGVIGVALAAALPERRPAGRHRYRDALASTLGVIGRHRQLRLRASYQALLFAGFNLFWTAAPIELLQRFGLSQTGVALFALAGAGGALAAPVAGWLSDRGHGRATTLAALTLFAAGCLLTMPAVSAGNLIAFGLLAILIDAAVQLNQISGQRVIFALDPAARGRINAAYMTIVFVIGASGSVLGSWSMARAGWPLAAVSGAALGGAALAIRLTLDRDG